VPGSVSPDLVAAAGEEDPLEIEQSEDVDLAAIQAIDAYVKQLHDGFVPTQSHMSRSLWRFIDRSRLPSEHIEAKVMEFLRKRVLVKRQTINGQGNELVTTELNVQHPLVVKALGLGDAEDEDDEDDVSTEAEPAIDDDRADAEWEASEDEREAWHDDDDIVDEPQPPNLENRSARSPWQVNPSQRRF
jgi:hypothetical protein